ncbi:unnamed protein product, partial [marine sediment metagenome]
GHYLDVNDNFNGNLWFEIVDRPPPEIDTGFLGTYSLGLDAVALSTWDTGTRISDGKCIHPSFVSSDKSQRLLGNSKKYSHLKETYGDASAASTVKKSSVIVLDNAKGSYNFSFSIY